jgi:hypothetical protein
MVAALNSNASLQARRERVAAILRRAVDVEGTGRFILGRWWRTATPAEQQEYLQLFEQTLIRNLASRFGEYQGVRFAMGRSQQRTEDDVLVTTVIERPGSPAITWTGAWATSAGSRRSWTSWPRAPRCASPSAASTAPWCSAAATRSAPCSWRCASNWRADALPRETAAQFRGAPDRVFVPAWVAPAAEAKPQRMTAGARGAGLLGPPPFSQATKRPGASAIAASAPQ